MYSVVTFAMVSYDHGVSLGFATPRRESIEIWFFKSIQRTAAFERKPGVLNHTPNCNRMRMTLIVEDSSEERRKEFEGLNVTELEVDLPSIPAIGTALRFDPPLDDTGRDTVACFVKVYGVDIFMDLPKAGKKVSKVSCVHIFVDADHRTTREALEALDRFSSR